MRYMIEGIVVEVTTSHRRFYVEADSVAEAEYMVNTWNHYDEERIGEEYSTRQVRVTDATELGDK